MKKIFTREQLENAFLEAKSAAGAAKLLGINFDTYKKYALQFGCYQTNQCGIGINKNIPSYVERGDFDYNYFDSLNSAEKAYILGFWAADSAPKKTSVTLNISAVDTYLLEYFCNCLQAESTRIKLYESRYSYNGEYRYSEAATCTFVSKHLLEVLNTYNIVTNRIKQNLDMFGSIPDRFKDAWLAGYIDGNGTFRKNSLTVIIATNISTCNSIIDYCLTYSPKLKYSITDRDSIVLLNIKDINFLVRYLYSVPFHLSRKEERARTSLYRHFGGVQVNTLSTVEQNVRNFCVDCGILISPMAVRCKRCAGILRESCNSKRPTEKELLSVLIETNCNFSKIGKIFSVADNTVRNWCEFYGIPTHTNDARNYLLAPKGSE